MFGIQDGEVFQFMADNEPDAIVCYFCGETRMEKKYRIETSKFVRVLWYCSKCGSAYWKEYGDKESAHERKTRWR